MAKVTYLELVELLSDKVKGDEKRKLEQVIARKKQLKEEDDDLNAVLDNLLREMRGEQANE